MIDDFLADLELLVLANVVHANILSLFGFQQDCACFAILDDLGGSMHRMVDTWGCSSEHLGSLKDRCLCSSNAFCLRTGSEEIWVASYVVWGRGHLLIAVMQLSINLVWRRLSQTAPCLLIHDPCVAMYVLISNIAYEGTHTAIHRRSLESIDRGSSLG